MSQQNNVAATEAIIKAYLAILGADAAIATIGALLNFSLVILILWKPHRLKKSRNLIFLVNLAFSDLSLSIFFLYIIISRTIFLQPFTMTGCRVEALFSQVFTINAIVSVMLLAGDRYLIVVKKKAIGVLECVFAIFFAWTVSILTGVSPLMADKNAFVINSARTSCTLDLSRKNPNLDKVIYIPTVTYIVALFLTVVCYFFIILTIRKTVTQIRRHTDFGRKSSSSQSQTKEQALIQQHSKGTPFSETEARPAPLSLTPKEKIMQRLPPPKAKSVSISSSNSGQTQSVIAVKEKRKKAIEIQLTKKTMILGATHFLLYLPTAIGSFLKIESINGHEIFESVGAHFILICLVFDPLWTFLLDPQIKKRVNAVVNFRKRAN